MPISIRAVAVVVLAIAAASCREPQPDACARAIERLARIDARQDTPRWTARRLNDVLDGCRRGTHVADDPVLRCAMDARSDDVAAACIDRFARSVVSPGGGGSGINPLLEPTDRPGL